MFLFSFIDAAVSGSQLASLVAFNMTNKTPT